MAGGAGWPSASHGSCQIWSAIESVDESSVLIYNVT